MKFINILSWLLRIIVAIILVQTLFFKFTAAPESVELFTKLGVEPWGRIATGVMELIASVLLLINATLLFGALLSLGLMFGAILSHITIIGIESNADGGVLFMLAIIVFVASLIILFIHRQQGVLFINKIYNKYKN